MVTYSITSKAGVTAKYNNAACFAAHYGVLDRYKEIKVFVEKRWLAAHAPYKGYHNEEVLGWREFKAEDFHEYARLLRVIGLKTTMVEEGDEFVWTVPLTENSVIASKTILNAIRYTCEAEYPGIVDWFLRFSKEKVVGVNLMTKLNIAHMYNPTVTGGHAYIPYYQLALPMSNADVKATILDNNKNITVCDVIPRCKKAFQVKTEEKDKWGNSTYDDGRKAITQLFKDGAPFKDIYKKYKERCAIFM